MKSKYSSAAAWSWRENLVGGFKHFLFSMIYG
jgi:hypothetical protein